MIDAALSLTLSGALLLAVFAGSQLRRRLSPSHLSRDALDSMRLLIGMLLTFAALVLGLLTSNAKQRFDGLDDALSAYGADMIELDAALRAYGPDAESIRAKLREYTAAAIADSWPGEAAPPGHFPRFAATGTDGIERSQLGDMLRAVGLEIEHLVPADDYHQRVAAKLRERADALTEQRWTLILRANATVPWPFLIVLASWLAIVFGLIGMTSPPGRLLAAVAVLSALSIASPLYIILEYGDALTGTIQLSSAPMRVALSHMDRN